MNCSKIITDFSIVSALILSSCQSQESKNLKELAKSGIITTAAITEIDTVNNEIKYVFPVKGKPFNGQFHSDKKGFQVHGLVEVVYLPRDPKINCHLNSGDAIVPDMPKSENKDTKNKK